VIVTSLQLTDFRNYERFALEPHPALTVMVGPNAVGKTNIMEALQLLTSAGSFRGPRWADLVRWGTQAGRASLRAEGEGRRIDVSLDVSADNARAFTVNGQVRRNASDVSGRLPSVIFTPDDLSLVKGPAELRRSAVDDLGAQLSRGFASLRRDYGRALRQRNVLLKHDAPDSELTPWNEELARLGARLVTHRLGLLDRVMTEAASRYGTIASGEELTWRYEDRCGLPTDPATALTQEVAQDAIAAELERRAGEERRRGVTLAGPHRDDIVFLVGGREARSLASQGQQRTIALAWKLAEVTAIEDVLRCRPLLLLDDVMSELDEERRACLTDTVTGRTQTFVTATNLGYFEPGRLADAVVIELGR
jgi:DNA replication and repair protein RecF